MPDRDLPAVIPPPAPAVPIDEFERVARYAESALAPSTRRAYERDWLTFPSWCAERRLVAIPAEPATVAVFLVSEADREFRRVPPRTAAPRCRRAPRAGPSEPVRLWCGRASPLSDPPPARHRIRA
jgi:hypothetical protein